MNDLPTVDGDEFPVQGWVGDRPPTESEFDPAVNSRDLLGKPLRGMWTSTLVVNDEGRVTTAWVEWRSGESWGFDDRDRLFALRPDPDATVYEIRSKAHLVALLDRYPRDDIERWRTTGSFAPIHFEALRDDGVDAVRLTAEAERLTRFSQPGLYGWDCESTVWLSWAFCEVGDPARLGPGEGRAVWRA